MLGNGFLKGDARRKGIRVQGCGKPQVAGEKEQDGTEKGLYLSPDFQTSYEPIEGNEAQSRKSPDKVYSGRAKPVGQDRGVMERRPEGDQDLEPQDRRGWTRRPAGRPDPVPDPWS